MDVTPLPSRTLSAWSLAEHLGRDWPRQVVGRLLSAPLPADERLAVVADAGRAAPAQLSRDGRRLWYPAELGAGARQRYELIGGDRPPESPLRWSASDGILEIATEELGVRLGWGDGVDSTPTPALAGVRGPDAVWFGASSWCGISPAALECELLEAGPVRLVARQVFTMADGGRFSCLWTVDCAEPALHLDMKWAPQVESPTGGEAERPAALELHMGGDFAPTEAYWRPHSPSPWRAPESCGPHKRQVYDVPPTADCLSLGPFYNWEKDAASFWCGWTEARRDLLYLGCPRPSRYHTRSSYERVAVVTGGTKGLSVRVPLQAGRSALTLALLNRDKTAICASGAPCDLDRLHQRLNGPDLGDYCSMVLEWPDMEQMTFPRLWVSAEDLPGLRQRFARWAWLRERFEAHAEDRLLDVHSEPELRLDPAGAPALGQDPAGAYLVTGDEVWAARARQSLVDDLDGMVESLLDYGPSVDGNLGISLARPWRALVLNLDLVLSSRAFPAEERESVLRKLAFVAEVSCTADAWPATGSGVHRGNDNFHPDVTSARGLAAAQLDGHPRQTEWLSAAAGEMTRFMAAYHLPSGMSRESATYQLCSLACALQLDAALRRRGLPTVVDQPVCKASLDFLASTQTPVDERCGHRMLPTVGHVTVHAWCQSLQAYFGWAARVTVDSDPSFSARMMAAWRRGGGFVLPLHDFLQSRIWSLPLCLLDPELPGEESPAWLKSRAHDGFGAILRADHGAGEEGYLALKMGECSGHYDNDEGSLIWYAYGQPLLIDYGCQYNPNFHAHPWLHNRLSIDHRADGYPRGGRLLGLHSQRGLDYTCGEVRVRSLYRETEWPVRDRDFDFRQVAGEPRPIDEHLWRRHLIYLHDLETLVLLDQVEGTLPTDWNLQVLADGARLDGNRARFRGSHGVDLSVLMALPEDPGLEVGSFSHLGFDEPRLPHWWWRGAAWTEPPGTEMTSMAERALTLRAHGGAAQSYMAMLVASREGEQRPELICEGAEALRVTSERGEATVRADVPGQRWYVKSKGPDGAVVAELAFPGEVA